MTADDYFVLVAKSYDDDNLPIKYVDFVTFHALHCKEKQDMKHKKRTSSGLAYEVK